MILGGCGCTLEEMVGLFSAFANEGEFVQPIYSGPHPNLPPWGKEQARGRGTARENKTYNRFATDSCLHEPEEANGLSVKQLLL